MHSQATFFTPSDFPASPMERIIEKGDEIDLNASAVGGQCRLTPVSTRGVHG